MGSLVSTEVAAMRASWREPERREVSGVGRQPGARAGSETRARPTGGAKSLAQQLCTRRCLGATLLTTPDPWAASLYRSAARILPDMWKGTLGLSESPRVC